MRIAGGTSDGERGQVKIEKSLTVKQLAGRLGVTDTAVVKHLFRKGHAKTVNMFVEVNLAREVALEMGFDVVS